jgi:hypothetical protein
MQGIVLVVAAADVLPRPAGVTVVAVALACLTLSFGRDVGRLWRARRPQEEPEPGHGRALE